MSTSNGFASFRKRNRWKSMEVPERQCLVPLRPLALVFLGNVFAFGALVELEILQNMLALLKFVVGKIMQLIPVFSLFYAGFNPNSELTTDWCWAQPRDVGEACKLYLVGSIRCAVVPTPSLTATRVHDLPLRLRDINIRTEMYWGMHLSWWVGTIYI